MPHPDASRLRRALVAGTLAAMAAATLAIALRRFSFGRGRGGATGGRTATILRHRRSPGASLRPGTGVPHEDLARKRRRARPGHHLHSARAQLRRSIRLHQPHRPVGLRRRGSPRALRARDHRGTRTRRPAGDAGRRVSDRRSSPRPSVTRPGRRGADRSGRHEQRGAEVDRHDHVGWGGKQRPREVVR